MLKLKNVCLAVVGIALLAMSALAAETAGSGDAKGISVGTGLAILGFGIAAGFAGIGQGLVGSKGAEGAARNPGAAGKVQTLMIIALALIESLVLFALVIIFVKA